MNSIDTIGPALTAETASAADAGDRLKAIWKKGMSAVTPCITTEAVAWAVTAAPRTIQRYVSRVILFTEVWEFCTVCSPRVEENEWSDCRCSDLFTPRALSADRDPLV